MEIRVYQSNQVDTIHVKNFPTINFGYQWIKITGDDVFFALNIISSNATCYEQSIPADTAPLNTFANFLLSAVFNFDVRRLAEVYFRAVLVRKSKIRVKGQL